MWSQISKTTTPLARQRRRSCSRCKVPEVSILFSVETFTYCLPSIGAKSNEEVFAAKIKQLTGECNCSPPWYIMLTFLAENAALHKANVMKENVGLMIPQPEKGSAGNGFNLQDRMGLKDNNELYGALRVSSFLFLHSFWSEYLQRCVRDAVNKAGLDCAIKWHRQPKHLIAQVIGVVRRWLLIFYKFPFTQIP